jgi:hypothetical protein
LWERVERDNTLQYAQHQRTYSLAKRKRKHSLLQSYVFSFGVDKMHIAVVYWLVVSWLQTD